ncbi:MAG: DNA polymerase III subunit delta' [Patescibacteria group bacterium]|nr:DNA polymerase III subunit delta' [Patescibacteria group bacterium]
MKDKTDLSLGNEKIQEVLTRLSKKVQSEDVNLSGAYIFAGPVDLGKRMMANNLVKSIVCESNNDGTACHSCPQCHLVDIGNHPDLFFLEKETDKKNISIEETREFIRQANMSSFGNYRFGIINNAENLNLASANALLKTMEEPASKTVLILITNSLKNIPKTIISRSQVFIFKRTVEKKIFEYLKTTKAIDRALALELAAMSQGSFKKAEKFLSDKDYLERRRRIADGFLTVILADNIERFDYLSEILKKDESGQSAVATATEILEIWQGVVRDLLLAVFNNDDLIVNRFLLEKINKAAKFLGKEKMIKAIECLNSATEELESNVNPRFVLENVILNIN